jgi:uncharacterized protein (DUF305 family)
MRRIVMGVIVAITALALTACGNSDGKKASPAEHNSADVAFVQAMIPHHEQAVEMARLAKTRAASAQVKTLAAQVEAAQGPEIKQMTGWLKSWGEPTSMPGMHGAGSAGHNMTGMMSPADMTHLATLPGRAFDRGFLTMMTAHHNGAIAMAKTEQTNGHYPAAIKLAGDIIKSQTAEVGHMTELLKHL